MIEVHAEFPQREVIQANAVVDNEEKTVSEVIISAKPEITGVTASVDNETGIPYVNVTETGTGTDFSFDLAFHNLKGDKGERGETGQTGQDGFSPSVTVEQTETGATITATDKDGTTSANLYNGTDGQDGTNGIDGQAATVTVGTTTTGAAGTNASVVNSGTSSAAILDFTIPRGDTGATGISVTGVNLVSTQGLQKTYRMTFSNNTYYDYIVTDGASGSTAWGGISGTLSNQTDLQTELTGLQSQIDAIVSSSDVFDIVGTYAELQAYNISTVPVNDIIKVLVDSTHSNAATYYRCVETGGVKSWSYIGSEGAHYTKSETDTLLNNKYDASNPAGYTANVGTVTSVNNTQPDANGNVTISVAGGANTDLSNLTATGEAHFQEPLVSGTNIKTINSNSILGSGNLTVTAEPEIFVATYGTTTYTEIQTAFNAGKAIFCKKDTSKSLGVLKDYETNYFSFFAGQSVGNLEFRVSSSNAWNTYTYTYLTSSSSEVASSRFDGEWVPKAVKIFNAKTVQNTSYDLANYLPSNYSTYAYEIYGNLYLSSAQSTQLTVGRISSPYVNVESGTRTDDNFGTSVATHSNSTRGFGSFIIVVGNCRSTSSSSTKSLHRYLYCQITGTAASAYAVVELLAYRRIGDNL